ncbi:MAG: GNAT family N-acetyltransferase [Pseudomonadota bacterium]
MSGLSVRTATTDDLPTVQALVNESWQRTYSAFVDAALIDEAIQDRHAAKLLHDQWIVDPELFLVAEREGDIVGHTYAFAGEDGYYLDRLHVSPTAKRGGIGAALMDEIERRALARGVQRISLEVMERNEPAVRFYFNRGYRTFARREACGATLPSPSLMVEKQLS